jgi:glycosyltransferase involved in cell wall biosynthesis
VTETIVTAFLAEGHEVTVATTDALDEESRVAPDAPPAPAGAEVIRFPNFSHRLAVRLMAWTPRGYWRWVHRNVARFDVVYLHDVYSVLSVAAARASASAGVPYVMQPFGSLAPTRERGKPTIKRVFLALWGRRTLSGARAVIHSTEAERSDFLAAGVRPEQLVDLPLPLELPSQTPMPKRARPTIAYVGRLHPIKGIDLLLHAFHAARMSIPSLRLEIIGPGTDYRRTLERLADRLQLGDAVEFHGFMDAEDKVDHLKRAHLFALLSRSEGLPVAVLEAMACGLPVIVSDGCHLPEVDGRAGVVVSGDPCDTSAAIASLLGDPERLARLGQGAREFADRFRADSVNPRIVELFRAIASGSEVSV